MTTGRTWWLQYVPRSRVRVYELLGWSVEPAAPSHHDVHKVLMRHDGPVEPPVPAARGSVTRLAAGGQAGMARARGSAGRAG